MVNSINEITAAKSDDRFGSVSMPSLLNTDVIEFTYLSKLVEQNNLSTDSFSIASVPPKTEPFNFDNVKNTRPKAAPEISKAEQRVKNIDNTRTILDYVTKVSAEQDFMFVTSSSDGLLSASRGIINLKNIKTSENKSKTILSSISNLAGGVGSVLMATNVPAAEFLSFSGKVIGAGLDRKNLSDNIKKKDQRGTIGATVSFSKSAWGAVVSGVNVTKIGAGIGENFGLVSSDSVGKISRAVTKISSINDKIALPFAVAATGLIFWDWRKSVKKEKQKEQEINSNTSVSNFPNALQSNQAPNMDLTNELKKLHKNSGYLGVSFASSAISTTALITSVAFPATAIITGPVTVSFGLLSSLMGILADDSTRDVFKKDFLQVQEKFSH